jgi:hypothetical protein
MVHVRSCWSKTCPKLTVQHNSYTSANSGHLQGHGHELPLFATKSIDLVSNQALTAEHLASGGAGDVGALVALLATSKADTRPPPARAGALATENVDRDSLGSNVTLDAVYGQISDRDTGSRLAGGRAVLVVLLDHDSVLGNLGNVSLGCDSAGIAIQKLTFLRVMFL